MVMEPKVLLLDEPLSNLDARLRLEMRAELQRVQKETGVTMIFVTHDQVEALALADRIVVMLNGGIEQIGTPEEIYNNPASAFVADFVGFENVFALKDGKLATPNGPVGLSGPAPEAAAGLAWRPRMVTPWLRCFPGHRARHVFRRQHPRIPARHSARPDQGRDRCRPAAARDRQPA